MALITTLAMAIFPLPDMPPIECTGLDHPAVLSVYNPLLDSHLPDEWNINCDNDCSTVATGPFQDWMYKEAGACPVELLGQTVYFPDIDHTMQCVDTGGAIKAAWSDRDNQCVVYFDALWPLEREDGVVTGAPYWAMWYLDEWEIQWVP